MPVRQFTALTLAASAVTALILGGASQAQALGYTFTYSDGVNIAYGTLSASGSPLLATSGTLFVTGGAAVGTYPLYPNPSPPNTVTSPGGSFIYDDLLFPGSDPLIDNPGLLFSAGGTEVNIFSNGPGNYAFYAANPPFNYFVASNGGAFTLTEVPEPGAVTFGLIAVGSVLGLVARKRKA